MARRDYTPSEIVELRQALHVATLDAMVASRRWQPGEMLFQGGSSLHLAYGSPRFSEDLDFVVDRSINLETVNRGMERFLVDAGWLPKGAVIAVTKAKAEKNPASFFVSLAEAGVRNPVKVKVEFWQADPKDVAAVSVKVQPVRMTRGMASGMQAFVPTAELEEIHADKVFAIGARKFLKPRDVFDLHWLLEQEDVVECDIEAIRVRLATYPDQTPEAWIENAMQRRAELLAAQSYVKDDLAKWLPSSWNLDETVVRRMIETSCAALDRGLEMMREIASERTPGSAP